MLKQKTFSKKATIRAISYFPKDHRVLYTQDNEGDELNRIYVLQINGKKRNLTPGKKSRSQFMGWDRSKSNFFILTNERNKKFYDIYKYSAKTYKRKIIFKNTIGVMPDAISDSGRWLTVSQINSNVDSNILLIDLNQKKPKPVLITPHKGFATYSSQSFTPDEKKLIYTTNRYGEFTQAWSYDLVTQEHKLYYKADWDISYLYFSKKGTYRIIGINQDAQTVIRIDNLKTGQPLTLPRVNGNILRVALSDSETKMALYVGTDVSPPNLYTTEVESPVLKKLTQSLNPGISESDLVHGHVVRYMSFDGLKIPSILFRPWEASEKAKVPAIVLVHGGPGGQSRKGYISMVQHLVNNGYAVLMVNNRGSSGYGKTFFHLDDRKHGEDDLKDCIWGKKYLQKLKWIDPNKIAIMGGSYGGYMTVAALTFAPEEFQAGIDIFGVTNWVRTLKSFPPYWESFKKYLESEIGHPEKDAEMLKKKSPLFYAENITKPLLVVQGANDPRVLQSESDDIVAAVKKNGVPVEYLLFKDEGHGFQKTKNKIKASGKYIEFLKKYLR